MRLEYCENMLVKMLTNNNLLGKLYNKKKDTVARPVKLALD